MTTKKNSFNFNNNNNNNNNNVGSGKFSRQTENFKNKITTINTLAAPVLVYSFGIANWLRK
jgi:hypothetical protein